MAMVMGLGLVPGVHMVMGTVRTFMPMIMKGLSGTVLMGMFVFVGMVMGVGMDVLMGVFPHAGMFVFMLMFVGMLMGMIMVMFMVTLHNGLLFSHSCALFRTLHRPAYFFSLSHKTPRLIVLCHLLFKPKMSGGYIGMRERKGAGGTTGRKACNHCASLQICNCTTPNLSWDTTQHQFTKNI